MLNGKKYKWSDVKITLCGEIFSIPTEYVDLNKPINKTNMQKFKVGDVASMTVGRFSGIYRGDTVKVVKVDEACLALTYLIRKPGDVASFWVGEKDLEPVSAKYKIGDKVKLVAHSYATNGLTVGGIYEVKDNTYNSGSGRHQYHIEDKNAMGFANDEHLAPVEEKPTFTLHDTVDPSSLIFQQGEKKYQLTEVVEEAEEEEVEKEEVRVYPGDKLIDRNPVFIEPHRYVVTIVDDVLLLVNIDNGNKYNEGVDYELGGVTIAELTGDSEGDLKYWEVVDGWV